MLFLLERFANSSLVKFSLLLFCLFLLSAKAFYIYERSNYCQPEVLAKNTLSDTGKIQLAKFLELATDDDKLFSFKTETAVEKNQFVILDEVKQGDTEVFSENLRALKASKGGETERIKLRNYIRENGLPFFISAAQIGTYSHHWNTILFPFREAIKGNLAYLLTAQNGAISVLPLFFFTKTPFNRYALIGIIPLVLVFALALLPTYKTDRAIIVLTLALMLTLTLNADALTVHPGFSYIRYLPNLIFVWLITKVKQLSKKLILLSVLPLALLNAQQFNFLIIAVIFSFLLFHVLFKRAWDKKIILILVIQASVFLVQRYFFSRENSLISFSGLESLKQVDFSVQSILAAWLVPVAVTFLLSKTSQGFSFNNLTSQTVLGICSYLGFSTYYLSQSPSPQHFSGFIFMSAYSCYLMLSSIWDYKYWRWPVLLLMCFPIFQFRLASAPKSSIRGISSSYFIKNNFGSPLTFSSSVDLSSLAVEYETLLKNNIPAGTPEDKVVFLSKDKVLLENYLGKNIFPLSYDSFVNFKSSVLKWKDFLRTLKTKTIQYIILDSKEENARVLEYLDSYPNMQLYLEIFSDLILAYDRLLDALWNDAGSGPLHTPHCSARYCVFKII